MSWIDELCEALVPVDPGFAAAIRPAAASELSHLTRLLGREIPTDYADYLARMGEFDGGLFYEERCDTRLAGVIGYCERRVAAGRTVDSAHCIPIALGADFEGYCLAMAGDPPHPPVAFLDDLHAGDVAFPSLPAMAFASAFYFEMALTGRTVLVVGLTGETRETLVRKLSAAGYRRQWYSSVDRIYLRSGVKLVIVVADRPARPTVQVGARDPASFSDALADLQEFVGVGEYRELAARRLTEIRESYARNLGRSPIQPG